MKAYLVSTCTVFGLITVAHILRVAEEGRHLMVQPFFASMTLVSASLCLWAGLMLWRGRR